jgi:acylphosphatase
VELSDVNPMLDSFSNISFRQFIGNKAREYRLTGDISDMEINFEGEEADADAFFDYLRDQGAIGLMYSCVIPSRQARTRRNQRLNTTFSVDLDEDMDEMKVEKPTDGLETTSVSSAD